MKKTKALGSLLICSLIFGSLSFATEAKADKWLDLQAEKKSVLREEVAEFRADSTANKQGEKETQKEFNVISSKLIKISAYTQVRYRMDKSINDTFDIRRARMDIRGDITDRFDYRTQIEFGGTAGPFLLDATVGYMVNRYLKLTAGQFKIPFSQENLMSGSKLDTINRSQVVEALVARSRDVVGNQNGRDIGVQASGNVFLKKNYNLLDYAFGVFNGSGINKADLNKEKDFMGRVVFHPLKDWSIGGSYLKGSASWGTPMHKNDRDRIGAEFAYVLDPISLKGEYIKGNDSETNKRGWYLQAGYYFIPKKFQGVFKYDIYNPNVAEDLSATRVYTLGVNLYLDKLAFLQINYELKDEASKEIDNNALSGQLTLQF